MKREVKFVSGYNCMDFECKFKSKKCVPGGGGSHGWNGLEIKFYVKGEKGAVQFILSTGWKPFVIEKDSIGCIKLPKNKCSDYFPMPTDLGFHSYVPMYVGQNSVGKCGLLEGKDCYYDGSSLSSHNAYTTLINAGEEALWTFLEQYYAHVFDGSTYPNTCEYPAKERSKQ